MAYGGGHERETLGKFVRNSSGYGTTVTNAKTSQHKSSKYFKHIVCQGDSLMGLSLKYHVTVEALKRENKLWTNDMLFLREFILIPLTPDNEELAPPDMILTVSDRERSVSSVSNGSHSLSSASDKEASGEAVMGGGGGGVKKDNPLDILNKYDSNIAKLKSDVAKMKTNAECTLTDEFLQETRRDHKKDSLFKDRNTHFALVSCKSNRQNGDSSLAEMPEREKPV